MTAITQTKALTVIMRADTGRADADAAIEAVKRDDRYVFRYEVTSSFFHQLRLRVAQEPALADKISVVYVDHDGSVKSIGLHKDDELKWPKGFEQECWEIETEILRVRRLGNTE